MIQQESQGVWGYGRGMARTIARTTRTDEAVAATETLGPMKFTRLDVGAWQVDLDVAGPTYIRYAAARILFSDSDDFQDRKSVV